MGFVKVKKGQKVIKVSESAYESQFKKAGWKRVKQVKQKASSFSEWDAVEDEDLTEKPISELTPDEVKKVAASKGIKTDGKNIRQLREEIKKRM